MKTFLILFFGIPFYFLWRFLAIIYINFIFVYKNHQQSLIFSAGFFLLAVVPLIKLNNSTLQDELKKSIIELVNRNKNCFVDDLKDNSKNIDGKFYNFKVDQIFRVYFNSGIYKKYYCYIAEVHQELDNKSDNIKNNKSFLLLTSNKKLNLGSKEVKEISGIAELTEEYIWNESNFKNPDAKTIEIININQSILKEKANRDIINNVDVLKTGRFAIKNESVFLRPLFFVHAFIFINVFGVYLICKSFIELKPKYIEHIASFPKDMVPSNIFWDFASAGYLFVIAFTIYLLI